MKETSKITKTSKITNTSKITKTSIKQLTKPIKFTSRPIYFIPISDDFKRIVFFVVVDGS
jgi:hypothetical protein